MLFCHLYASTQSKHPPLIVLVQAKTAGQVKQSGKVDTDWLFTDEEMDMTDEWRNSKWDGMSNNLQSNISELHEKGMMIDKEDPKGFKTLKGRQLMASSALEDSTFMYYFGTIKSASTRKKGSGRWKVMVKYDGWADPYEVELKYNFWTGGDVWHEPTTKNQWRLLVKK